jgi:hypothetical protein
MSDWTEQQQCLVSIQIYYGAVGLTWAGVAGDGASDDEYAGADGRTDPEQHELKDAELPHEALAGGGGGGGAVGAEGLPAERRGAEAREEGAAGGGGGPVAVGFLHGV